jgi:surfactin synthase thioesterase subunit/glycosyltransferase involved in cell wall biosynthesis
MRILLAHNSTYYPSQGGGDKSNRLLMEALAARGHAVEVVTRLETFGEEQHRRFLSELGARGVVPEGIEDAAVRFELSGVAVHTLTRDPNIRGYFTRQIGRFDPEVILLSTDDPGQLLLGPALEAPRARVIFLVRASIALPFGPDSSAESVVKTNRLREVDAIVGVSEYVARYVREHGRMDATHVPISLMEPGVPELLGNFDNPFVVMVNPCAVKGITIFLGLADRMPNVRFAAVASWGTSEEELAALRARPNVTLLDRADDIDEILKLTRVLVVPSIWNEARARVVLEGMSRGVPVMASDVGGLPEAKMGVEYLIPVNPITRYGPGLDSRMVPIAEIPPQDVEPWHAALRRLLDDQAHYDDVAKRSREAALHYLDTLTAAPFEQLLTATVRKPRIPAPAPGRLSPEKQRLLALRIRQKSWFPNCRSRLFCFPYAGAGLLWCHGWNACPVLLPGREARLAEAPSEEMGALVATLEEVITPLLGEPYAFFGHSMGAGIAFELTHALRRAGKRLPGALIVSSAKAPRLRTALPDPDDSELLAQVERLGGAPAGAAADPDWMRVVFPALRADTRLYRRYQPGPRSKLEVPIYAYCGDADPTLHADEMEGWGEETSADFRLRVFRGGHFYFRESTDALLRALEDDQAGVTGPSSSTVS